MAGDDNEVITDKSLRASLFEQKMAAVALGVCIARTLAKQDATILRHLAEEAQRMHKHLCDHDHGEWAEVLVSFALALGRPEAFSLFHPPVDPQP